jgi:hypothetical protein
MQMTFNNYNYLEQFYKFYMDIRRIVIERRSANMEQCTIIFPSTQ